MQIPVTRSRYTLPVLLAVTSGAALVASQALVWFYAPVEQTMGLVQKIFYLHMPLAWWALVCFFTVFAASIGYLLQRRPAYDILAGAAAELGVVFSGLALLTGSLWARAAWNTWWTWDPRLSTTLIMWFIYAAYLILRGSELGGERRRTLCAVLGIVAFLDVPLVFLSARLWRSIHPAVLASAEGGLEPEMLTTVLVGLGAWGVFVVTIVWLRWRQLRDKMRLDALLSAH